MTGDKWRQAQLALACVGSRYRANRYCCYGGRAVWVPGQALEHADPRRHRKRTVQCTVGLAVAVFSAMSTIQPIARDDRKEICRFSEVTTSPSSYTHPSIKTNKQKRKRKNSLTYFQTSISIGFMGSSPPA